MFVNKIDEIEWLGVNDIPWKTLSEIRKQGGKIADDRQFSFEVKDIDSILHAMNDDIKFYLKKKISGEKAYKKNLKKSLRRAKKAKNKDSINDLKYKLSHLSETTFNTFRKNILKEKTLYGAYICTQSMIDSLYEFSPYFIFSGIKDKIEYNNKKKCFVIKKDEKIVISFQNED